MGYEAGHEAATVHSMRLTGEHQPTGRVVPLSKPTKPDPSVLTWKLRTPPGKSVAQRERKISASMTSPPRTDTQVLPGHPAFDAHTLLMFVPPAHRLGVRKLVPTWHSASLEQGLFTLPVKHLDGAAAKLQVPGVSGTPLTLIAL